MSHLTDFVQLYSRFGVTCKVNKHEEGYNVILTEDIHADITDTASEKFEGYNGFLHRGNIQSRRAVYSSGVLGMNTSEKIIGIIQRQMGIKTVHVEQTFIELGMDSLDSIELIMEIEDEFEITINEYDIALNITTVKELVDYVRRVGDLD